jgi:ankyrin repeat protein
MKRAIRFTIAGLIIFTTISVLVSCGSLSKAAWKGDLKKVKSYLQKGEDVNQIDNYGWTALHWAVYYQYYDVTLYLLRNRANPNIRTTKSYRSIYAGTTPLLIASYYGKSELVGILLKAGAKVNAQDSKGNTPLKYARNYKFTEVVRLLKGRGALTTFDDVKPDRSKPQQVIYLNDGSRIVGEIISQSRTHVTIKTKYTVIKVEKGKVSEIKYK